MLAQIELMYKPIHIGPNGEYYSSSWADIYLESGLITNLIRRASFEE